jgi:hypothetical protein
MRKIISLLLVLLVLPVASYAQSLDGLDFISPFQDGVAAIKKGETWSFINEQGELLFDFRDDLVVPDIKGKKYPVFNSNRCLISLKKEGITYFGYIDKKGKAVLESQFLNATAFKNGKATVVKLYKNVLGTNDVLDKQMIEYNYMEVAIDTNGEIVHYFDKKPTHVTLEKNFLKKPPKIKSKFISDNLIATQNKDKTWAIKKYKL